MLGHYESCFASEKNQNWEGGHFLSLRKWHIEWIETMLLYKETCQMSLERTVRYLALRPKLYTSAGIS